MKFLQISIIILSFRVLNSCYVNEKDFYDLASISIEVNKFVKSTNASVYFEQRYFTGDVIVLLNIIF